MPDRLLVCTPSRLSTFEDCPRRYRYSYLDRPAPPRGPAWAHNSLGASVHTALRNWYGLPAARRQPSALLALLRATWVGEGYRDREQERVAFGVALRWLEGYVADLDPEQEPVGVERVVAFKTGTIAFSGRVDRIDRRAALGDALAIVDYKTGQAGLGADDARGSRTLALYAYAAERVFRRRCRVVELHHLPTQSVVTHEHTDGSLARHVARAEAVARDIADAQQAVRAGTEPDAAFPTRPGPMCSWCDFRSACPAGAAAPARVPWARVLQNSG
ncbi:MAG: PD-(D/E)XK nuclease family protein [Micromonosporaceae bacterium]|nr:PD-(D/E)XK nuclease family protein [Micromonosporaceae bacterium]